jgi:hypothetical protein
MTHFYPGGLDFFDWLGILCRAFGPTKTSIPKNECYSKQRLHKWQARSSFLFI